MRNGLDATPALRSSEVESFGNRKLIRPTLGRDQARLVEAAAEHRERSPRPAERSPGTPAKKAAPAEQTHAENFYYQKQMQSKTPMVVVTRDGEELHGVIEWYDKCCLKLNRAGGQSNLMIYKASIRYMFKEAEVTK